MKKGWLLLFYSVCFLFSYAQDTIGMCERKNNYLYGDLWIDEYGKFCKGACDYRHTVWQIPYLKRVIVVKHFEIDSSLRIIGVAAPVLIINRTINQDTSRVPEYFYVYDLNDTGCVYIARTRWDNTSIRHYMEFVYGERQHNDNPYWSDEPDTNRIYIPVYEAYFGKPITVYDSFYVGGSAFNNTYDESAPSYPLHPETFYVRWSKNQYTTTYNLDTCQQIHIYVSDKKDKIKYIDNSSFNDTLFHFNQYIWCGFGCFFPIFDTLPIDTSSVTTDTCQPTTGFRIMDISGNNIFLTWNQSSNQKWEISLVKGDTTSAIPDNGIINIYNTNNFASFIDLDTACYTAFIRTICDNDIRSEWSQALTFCLPQDTADLSIAQSTVDRFTFVAPNPSGNIVNILSSFSTKSIEIFTLDGKLISTFNGQGISTTLDLTHLASGTYILRIKTSGGITTKKLVKQ